MKIDLSSVTPQSIRRGINYIKNAGIDGIMSELRYKMRGPGFSYDGWYKKKHMADEQELERQRGEELTYSPKVSIIVSVYRTPVNFLSAMLESVIGQTYANWELVIVDGSRTSDINIPETKNIVQGYMEKDERINYILLDEDIGISECLNLAVEMSSGDYVALLSHDDMITQDALYTMVNALQEDKAYIIYSDEDKMSEEQSRYSEPAFKPDFDIDLLRAYNYIGYFTLVKRSLVQAVGGFRREYEGISYYDFILRCCERVWGERNSGIRHIPRVLYHMRKHGETAEREKKRKNRCEIGRKAVEEHLNRMGVLATVAHSEMPGIYKVTYDTPGNPFLSIVIVGANNPDTMKKCILPLYERARYSNFEIIIVDRYEGNETLNKFYRSMESTRRNIHIKSESDELSVPRLREKGAAAAMGDYLLFIDAETEVMQATAIGEMLGICMRNEVGAVGGILYGDNDSTYKSCYAVGKDGQLLDVYKGLKRGDKSYMMRNRISSECSAVSASCMMVKRELFHRVGGFSEKFDSWIADIDFCLRVIQRGLVVVMAADAGWYIHNIYSLETVKPSSEEMDLFDILWGQYIATGDRYLSNHFL